MRILWVISGHLCLLIGMVGIAVPLLPTTPFVLLAAYCYSKGSRRFLVWLHRHRHFGPILGEWNRHGVIRPRAKLFSSSLLLGTLAYPLFFTSFPGGLKLTAALVSALVLSFILTRPSRPAVQAVVRCGATSPVAQKPASLLPEKAQV